MKIGVIYSHHKLGDLIWQLPYIKSISEYHKKKIILIVRPKTQAKDILKDLNYIEKVEYNFFRKKLFYWIDVFKIFLLIKKNKFTHIYLLDKVSRGAIAAKLSGIKNIIGPGLGNQKHWLTNEKFLSKEDGKLNYSDQSKKFLELNKIFVKDTIPHLNVEKKTLEKISIPFSIDEKKINIALGVDSFEEFKMWYEESFSELANQIIKNKLGDFFYLISSKDNQYMVYKIMQNSNKNIFQDCSNLNLIQIIKVIKKCNYFIGNNSGPLNLSSALNTKCFGLIANDPVSELKNSNIIPITPKDYTDNVWNRNREGMKKITVSEVINVLKKNLSFNKINF